jgi:hypothetical protein
MQTSQMRASATISPLAPSARIKRGTADQSFGLDTLGLASVHTIYPRRRRSKLSGLAGAARASLIPAICGVAAAYIILTGAPAMTPAVNAAPAIEAAP